MGLSSPVFPTGTWRLEAERRPAGRQNSQAGKPALRTQRDSTPVSGLNRPDDCVPVAASLSLFARLIFLVLAGFLAVNTLTAQVVWTGAGAPNNTNWSISANWSGGVPGPTANILFTNAGSAATVSNINNVVDTSTTLQSLQYANSNILGLASSYHTTLINPGVTLAVSNNAAANLLIVGTLTDNGLSQIVDATMTGAGGTLTVVSSNANSQMFIQQGSTNSGTHNAILDLSGLGTFNLTAGRLLLAANGLASPPGASNYTSGTLLLAGTNVIQLNGSASPALDVGDAISNPNPTCTNILQLGQTNALYVDTMTIGRFKSTGSIVNFNPSLAGNNPALYLRGNSATRIAALTIGDNFTGIGGTGTGGTSVGTMDLSLGTVDAQVNTCYIGRGQITTNTGGATGTLTLNAGIFNVNMLNLATETIANARGNVTGTINVNGTATLVVNTNLGLGCNTNSAFSPVATATLNINSGTVYANAITAAATASNGVIATINVNGGALYLTNTAGTPAQPLSAVNLASASLHLNPSTTVTNIVATNVAASGMTTITIDSVAYSGGTVTYPLISYSAGTDPFGGLTLASLGTNYVLLVDNQGSQRIDLQISPTPLLGAVLWGGGANNHWDTTSLNWTNEGVTTLYSNTDFVTFSDLGQTGYVSLATNVAPGSVTVSNAAVAYTFSGTGAIGGAGNLTKSGPGTLTLGTTNTYSGGTFINGGTFTPAVPGALPANSVLNFGGAGSATVNLPGLALVLANLLFTNYGASSITFTGASGSALTVSPPALALQPQTSANSLALNLSGLGAFTYSNSTGTFTANNGLTAAGGSTGQTTVTLAGGTNSITAATLNVANLGTSSGVVNSTLNLGASNTLRVGTINLGTGRSGGTIQFAGGITNGTLTIAGVTGASSTATLAYGGHDSYQASDQPVDIFDTTGGALNAQFGSMTVGKASPSTLTTANRGVSFTSSFKMGAGTLTASSLSLGVIPYAPETNNTYNYTWNNSTLFSIANGGTANLTNVIVASNAYTGLLNTSVPSTLSATVSLTNGATLNATTIQEGSIASPSQGTLSVTSQILCGNATIANLPGGGLTVSGVSVVLLGPATFNLSSGQNGTVSSVISGPGALTKSGAGTLTLSGANANSGATTVNAGTLIIGGSGNWSAGSYPANITNNATLVYNSSATQLLSGAISGTGRLTQSGPGLLTLIGANTYTGTTSVSNGTLQVNGVLGNTTVTVANGGTLLGHGIIGGATAVQSGGTLTPGLGGADNSPLVISNSLNLGGNVVFSLNRNDTPSNSKATGIGALTYGGTLTVTNLGGPLQSGDSFSLFQAGSYTGGFKTLNLPPLLSGLSWNTNSLTNGFLSVAGTTTLPTLGITATNISKTYGQAVVLAGTGCVVSGLQNSDQVTNVTLACAGAASNAPVGAYPIVPGNAQGTGLTNYNIIYTNGALTVNVATPAMTTVSGGSPTVYGDSLALTVNVTPVLATGTVQFLANGMPFDTEPLISGGAVSALISTLPVGTNLLAAIYSGDGNVLPATNTLTQVVTAAPAQTNGLTAQYFNDTAFTILNTQRLDAAVNFNWSNTVPAGTALTNGRPFAIRWSGQLMPGYSETYSFYVTANSGARLWVNDQLLLNTLSPAPPSIPMMGSLALQAGMRYNVQLEYLSSGSNSSVQLAWSSPSTPRQPVPTTSLVPFTDPHQRGSILTEIWQNLPGTSVATLTGNTNYPNQPNQRDANFAFECIATNWGTNYGEKVSGYLEPTVGGYYTFSVAAADAAELWLSTNAAMGNKVRLLAVTNATGYRQFTNLSSPIRLAAWQPYYVELLHKAGAGGNDHYSVAWLPPGQSGFAVIGGDHLVPNYLDQTNPAAAGIDLTNLSQSHPRLLVSAPRFAWLQSTLAAGSVPQLNTWWTSIDNAAVALETTPVNTYTLDSTGDILNVSRSVLTRMYQLSLAYRLTGNTNFAERAWLELQQVASTNFPDWNPPHFLDTAEMTHACAIGYDWLYDYWTPARLSTMAIAIQTKGLYPGYTNYQTHAWWSLTNANNWNLVCNSGMALGVLALGTDAGTTSYKTNQYIISNALCSASAVTGHYSTDNGAWYEGPGYWDFATDYIYHLMAGMDTALGTDLGLSGIPGFGNTGDFAMGMMGMVLPSNQDFIFADTGGYGTLGSPPMFWLSRRYDRPEYAAYERTFGYTADSGPAPLDLLWYNPNGTNAAASNLPPDNYYRGLAGPQPYSPYNDPVNVMTLRTDWQNTNATAVFFKTGTINDSGHDHLDAGSFMLDSLGVRWAQNMGDDSYALPGYFSTSVNGQRWTYYRLRAEGKNTLVINPGVGPDQILGAAPPIWLYSSHPNGDDSYAVADLTPAYGINKVWRGVKLFQNRRWFLVQDEIQSSAPANVWWFMHISASQNVNIQPNGQSVLLTSGGSQLWLTNLTGVGSFALSNAVPLPTSPNPAGQATNSAFMKLAIHLPSVTNTTLAVLMVPLITGQALPTTNLTAVTPLSTWASSEVGLPPMLTPIANQTVLAGATLLVTNQAADSNVPPQPLAFSLTAAPTGAAINSSNGLVTWRPAIAQAGTSNLFAVVVTQTGGSQLSATQSFRATVTSPNKPTLGAAAINGSQFQMSVSGDYGPDYTVAGSSNLLVWTPLFTTNSPVLPFLWSLPLTNGAPQLFFRVLLGP